MTILTGLSLVNIIQKSTNELLYILSFDCNDDIWFAGKRRGELEFTAGVGRHGRKVELAGNQKLPGSDVRKKGFARRYRRLGRPHQ